jgi:hypothetical protein
LHMRELHNSYCQHSGRLVAAEPGFDSRQGKDFSLLHSVQTGSGVQLASYPMCTRDVFQGVKQSGREADHSTLSSAEVKNGLGYNSTPPYVTMAQCLIN